MSKLASVRLWPLACLFGVALTGCVPGDSAKIQITGIQNADDARSVYAKAETLIVENGFSRDIERYASDESYFVASFVPTHNVKAETQKDKQTGFIAVKLLLSRKEPGVEVVLYQYGFDALDENAKRHFRVLVNAFISQFGNARIKADDVG